MPVAVCRPLANLNLNYCKKNEKKEISFIVVGNVSLHMDEFRKIKLLSYLCSAEILCLQNPVSSNQRLNQSNQPEKKVIKEKNWVETTSLIDVNEKPMQSQMTFHVQLKITSTNGKALWGRSSFIVGGGGVGGCRGILGDHILFRG